jgi:hypothetical protein
MGEVLAPNSDDANAARCTIDYILELDAFAFGLASTACSFGRGNFSCLRFEFVRPLYAELRHLILKLDPIGAVQHPPLLGGSAIKGDPVTAWTNRDALQNSILSFLRDLRSFYSGGLFQEFGRDRHFFGFASTLSQAFESFLEFFGARGYLHPLALIAQISR